MFTDLQQFHGQHMPYQPILILLYFWVTLTAFMEIEDTRFMTRYTVQLG